MRSWIHHTKGRHVRQARVGLGDLREEHISRQGFAGPVAMIYREHGPNEVVRIEGTLLPRRVADTARVEEDVAHALYTYLNPLVGGNATGPGSGWPFGRALNQGELYGVVHAVEGVEFVRILRIYETNLETGEQSAKPGGTHIVLEPDELLASGQHIVKATHRED